MEKLNKEDRVSDYERAKELLDSMNVRYTDQNDSNYIFIDIDESVMISYGTISIKFNNEGKFRGFIAWD